MRVEILRVYKVLHTWTGVLTGTGIYMKAIF